MASGGRAGGTGLRRVQPLTRCFYAVARPRQLGKKPLAVTVWGRRFVLFREASGRAVALLDRCPHRNVPLSSGRVNEVGQLECAYHGWCFDAEGACVAVPGSVGTRLPVVRVPRFEVREDAHFLWLCPSEHGPLFEPFELPHQGEPGYTTVIRDVTAEASLYAVVENALDVPHTAVLHRGLFRSDARSRVRVRVSRDDRSVEAEYSGEPAPRGLLGRLLSLGAASEARELSVEHWDRFYLPSVLQVEYRLGRLVHFVVTGLCLPVEDDRTRLWAVASFRTPLPGRLLAFVLEPFARWVFAQDRRMLSLQTENVLAFEGEEFASTELDAVGPSVWKLIRQAAAREREQQATPTEPEVREIIADFELDA